MKTKIFCSGHTIVIETKELIDSLTYCDLRDKLITITKNNHCEEETQRLIAMAEGRRIIAKWNSALRDTVEAL